MYYNKDSTIVKPKRPACTWFLKIACRYVCVCVCVCVCVHLPGYYKPFTWNEA